MREPQESSFMLTAGGIYTIAAFNGFGRVYAMQIKFHSAKPYLYLGECQRDGLNLLFYPQNPQHLWQKKKLASVIWWPTRPMIIWEGAKEPNVSTVVRRDIDDRFGSCAIAKIWGENDPRYLMRAKSTVFDQPVWEFIPAVEINQPEFSVSED